MKNNFIFKILSFFIFIIISLIYYFVPSVDKLIGILVSTNYMDTLPYFLENNHHNFTRLYLVTSINDIETINYCKKYYNIELIYFDFKNNNNTFNKGGALRKAQKIAYETFPNSWYLFLDSDIILPINMLTILKLNTLNKNYLYGCYRYIIKNNNDLENLNNIDILKNKWELGAGFFQLHFRTDILYKESYSASKTDDEFKFNFEIISIDKLKVYHLGTAYKNWEGKLISFDNKNLKKENLVFMC